jgi:hypothetical protein
MFRGAAGIVLLLPVAAYASSQETTSLTGYLIKIGLGLGLFALAGYAAVFFSGRRRPFQAKGTLCLLASLPLGRDVLFVVRCGPDAIAILSGGNGSRVIGRWRYEEWLASWNETSET